MCTIEVEIKRCASIESQRSNELSLYLSLDPLVLGGRGVGSEIDFHFLVVSDRGGCQLTGTFYGMKKYCS